MAVGDTGSAPSATPGRPWVSMLIHRICPGSSGTTKPRNGASSITNTSASPPLSA